MDEYIKKAVNLYVNGQITKDSLAGMLAKKYTKMLMMGKFLAEIEEELASFGF